MMIDTTTCRELDEADLLPSIDVIENQGRLGTCTGQGVVKVLEVQSARAHDIYPHIPVLSLSVLYNYYWSGNFENRVGQEGRSPEDAFMAALVKGICSEALWPYDETLLDVQPPVVCDIEAQRIKIREYCSLTAGTGPSDWALAAEKTRSNMRHAICQGRPVGISIAITEDFMRQWTLQSDWRTFHWNHRPSASNAIVGVHEAVAMGHSNAAGRFLIQNSWDDQCDGGFFGFPYELVGDQSWGLGTAFCTVSDSVGHIPLPGYVPIVYPPDVQQGIRNAINGQVQPLTDAAKQLGLSSAQIDAAMSWIPGDAKRFLKL